MGANRWSCVAVCETSGRDLFAYSRAARGRDVCQSIRRSLCRRSRSSSMLTACSYTVPVSMLPIFRVPDSSCGLGVRACSRVRHREPVRPSLEASGVSLYLNAPKSTISPIRRYPAASGCKWSPESYSALNLSHNVERYGRAEVERWYFEVWNEPNLLKTADEAFAKIASVPELAHKPIVIGENDPILTPPSEPAP